MAAVSIASGGTGGGVRRILVADDERHIVRLVQVILERAGYQVVCAFTAGEALERVIDERPDFLILDTSLPDIDGYALTRQIRSNSETAALPIQLFLPCASQAEIDRARDAGADYWLTKPFSPSELLQIVRNG